MWASISSTCSWVTGRPSSISARASAIHRRRHVENFLSGEKKFSTWRRLWIALARAEMELGLPVTQEQVDETGGPYHRYRL